MKHVGAKGRSGKQQKMPVDVYTLWLRNNNNKKKTVAKMQKPNIKENIFQCFSVDLHLFPF